MKNIFYFYYLNTIGGVETFFYYLAKKYKDWDITIYYSLGDQKQIDRLKKYVRVKQYKGEIIKCDKAFFNYNPVIIDNVEAKEYIQIIHADYKAQEKKADLHPKITKVIGVSQLVCDTFKEISGVDCELCYNPVELDEPEDVLLIVSATRLNQEVKGRDNIIKVGNKLNELGKPYLWLIFTNDFNVIDNPNIIYMNPKLDISGYLKKADIVAQLSNSESYGFTPNEALELGTPVLLMDLPIWKELGIKDGKHGWIIKDIDSYDFNKLWKKLPNFKYEVPKDNWENILAKGKSTYEEEKNMKYEVKALDTYVRLNKKDQQLNKIPKEGEKWIIEDKERLDMLLGDNKFNEPFVELVKEIKPSMKKTSKKGK